MPNTFPDPSLASNPSCRQPALWGANSTCTEQLTGVPEQLGVLVFVNSTPYASTNDAGVDDKFVKVMVWVEFEPSESVPKLVNEFCAPSFCVLATIKTVLASRDDQRKNEQDCTTSKLCQRHLLSTDYNEKIRGNFRRTCLIPNKTIRNRWRGVVGGLASLQVWRSRDSDCAPIPARRTHIACRSLVSAKTFQRRPE